MGKRGKLSHYHGKTGGMKLNYVCMTLLGFRRFQKTEKAHFAAAARCFMVI